MTHVCLGDALWEVNRHDEARQEYRDAITMAQTAKPEFQKGWIPYVPGEQVTQLPAASFATALARLRQAIRSARQPWDPRGWRAWREDR